MNKYLSIRFALIMALLMAGACSDQPTEVQAPVVTPQHDWNFGEWQADRDEDGGDGEFDNNSGDQQPDLRFIAKFRTRPAPPDPLLDHAMIGPEGGSLRVGDFEIIVPAGAVDRPKNFSIRVPTDPRLAIKAYAEFGPHMHFNKPVTIRLPAASTEVVGQPYVLWWAGSFWWPLSTTATSDGRIEAKVDHFSIYGTSAFSKGITPLGS